MRVVRSMTDSLRHRGPDDDGHWSDPAAGIALGQRRLSIIDLSGAGHQPMLSASGRYYIVFNGEVYNFNELRRELDGIAWRGYSDTEVMLAAIERWGLRAATQRFVGMFAFAVWDRKTRTLHLVRDRLGIKPLYYGFCGATLLFGSELKALRCHADFHPEIDRDTLALFLRHNYVPGPYTIYVRTWKLAPGTILSLRSHDDSTSQPTPYWDMREVAERGQSQPFRGKPEEAVGELDRLLREAVRLRMIADVPLGAFLSGGIDSSTVVALMQAQSTRPVRTFSIGFEETAYNEAQYAARVARHLGTEHTELYVTSADALAMVQRLPHYYDEPFSDSSQIPTMMVCALARRHVTVALSGDGGDELFSGYDRYTSTERLWRKLSKIPLPFRVAAAAALRATLHWWRDDLSRPFMTSAARANPLRRRRLEKLALALPSGNLEAFYQVLISHAIGNTLVLGAQKLPTRFDNIIHSRSGLGLTPALMYLDTVNYLPDDILTKVDRASMAVGLEARVPLLDHRVVEFAWTVPMSYKVRDGAGKWILRQLAYRYIPHEMLHRRKAGFSVPLARWLRGELRDWAEAMLDESRLQREGFFNVRLVRRLFHDHLSGRAEMEHLLWDLLIFQAWHEQASQVPAGSSQPLPLHESAGEVRA